jgi:hypothetical protein
LQKLLRIVEDLVGLARCKAQRSSRKLLRNGALRHRRISRHKTNFVDVNVRVALQRLLQLLRQLARLRSAAGGETAHEFRQAHLRNFRRKVNARDA